MKRIPLIRRMAFYLILVSAMPSFNVIFGQQENLNVFDRWIEWSDGKNMLVHYMNKQAFDYLDKRDREIAGIHTGEEWIQRQKKVKDILMKIAGPFPEKTPLNPKVTGILKKDGYRIEKIIYESMPGFYVTGCLFVPDGLKGKNPAILNVIGHTGIAFRGEVYQTMILHLVQKGFIVFAIDPVGQGERIQYYDPGKKASVIGGEHSYFGKQCLISGVSSGRYFIWDGIRGIDYLLTRKEVDPERLGVTGLSGGGTLTAYISAFDDRVRASAPSCYITGFRRLLESIGPQDAEQNFYHAVKNGITHADFIEARAPKPTLMVTTTRDYFNIQGARETYAEAKEAFKALGKGDDLNMVEDDFGHGFTPRNNEATCAFFQKYLNLPGNPAAGEIKLLAPDELNATPTGQLANSIGGETVFSINKKESLKLVDRINNSRQTIEPHLKEVMEKAKELTGFKLPSAEIRSVFRGRYQRDGYAVEMYALKGDGNYVIPLLLFIPGGGKNCPGIIYVHPKGKIADAAPGGKIEQLVRKGYLVAAPDVLGTGEVAPDKSFYSSNYFLSVLTGRTVTAIQAEDILRVAYFLKTRSDADVNKIGAIAFDEMCPSLLHAAVFDNSIRSVVLNGSLVSYRSVVMNRFYDTGFTDNLIPGVLTGYDLPDLIGCLAPRKIAMSDIKDQSKQPASRDLVNEEYSFPKNVYNMRNAGSNFSITGADDNADSVIDWCFK
jgi:cephalosporin-C deacetylase-like acetyl esterase